MAQLLRSAATRAQLASIEDLLRSMPGEDIVGRLGFESKRRELIAELEGLNEGSNTLAATALYFGGKPVIASVGIEADFAARAISNYQDFVAKIWATSSATVAERGPLPDQKLANLHVTALLHGSVGFLFEEIEPRAVPLFPTPIKIATDKADELITTVGQEADAAFDEQLEQLAPRAFSSMRSFFSTLHKSEASIRVVDATRDVTLDRATVDRAFVRLEDAEVLEEPFTDEGLLVGIIPVAGRFEFRRSDGQLINGTVAKTMSEDFLHRLEGEQRIGRYFQATLSQKVVSRFGRQRVTYTLLALRELER
jgi:hypothetical protein